MLLSTKENELLRDMKSEEELCIKKYTKYMNEAKCDCLKQLFNSIITAERSHLDSINSMMQGVEPESPKPLSEDNSLCTACRYDSEEDKAADAFLCQDLLGTEKHVSSLYNTSVFEFKSPKMRKMLSHIQTEEQQHGEKLYAFMSANGMYN